MLPSLPYTAEYIEAISPLNIVFSVALSGRRWIPFRTNFRYLELGCGNGISLCVFAKAYPKAHFVGVDFDPRHISFAQIFARDSQLTNIEFIEADLNDWSYDDVVPFDFVTMHGVLSWVSEITRLSIRRIVDACLKPGGLFYVSYNALPGIQPRLVLHDVLSCSPSLSDGFAQLDKLRDRYPEIPQWIAHLKTKDPRYLEHEYLVGEMTPFAFQTVSNFFEKIHLRFVSSVTPPADLSLDESFKDIIFQTEFRRDVYIKAFDDNTPVTDLWQMLFVTNKTNCTKETPILISRLLCQRAYSLLEFLRHPTLSAYSETDLFEIVKDCQPLMSRLLPYKLSKCLRFTCPMQDKLLTHFSNDSDTVWWVSPVLGGAQSLTVDTARLIADLIQNRMGPYPPAAVHVCQNTLIPKLVRLGCLQSLTFDDNLD